MQNSSLSVITADKLDDSFFSVRRLSDGLDEIPRILESVRAGGDCSVREAAARFDRANPGQLEVGASHLEAAAAKMKRENSALYAAICRSRDLALAFAARQRECFTDFTVELDAGLVTGQRTLAVERAGIYVPAGRFPLLSTVIMCASPARAAGVDEIIMCTPPVSAEAPWADERILAAACLCGVNRVFAIGGSQAIGAMAYGTETVPRVQVIVGPGNRFVTAAKKYVYGEVGIDMLAGPSEVLIIADESAHPAWVAADLYAQAEHDPDAQAVLVTTSADLAARVVTEVDLLLAPLGENAPARQSFRNHGTVILVSSFDEAVAIANRKCPEHLELAMNPSEERDRMEAALRNFGSLFVGHRSAEVLGDYSAGLNHTLPTAGSASFTGGLSVRHFLKTVTTLRADDGGKMGAGVIASLEAAAVLAEAEGLSGHALAANIRLGSA